MKCKSATVTIGLFFALSMIAMGLCWASHGDASEKLQRHILGTETIGALSVVDANGLPPDAHELMRLTVEEIGASIGIPRDCYGVSVSISPSQDVESEVLVILGVSSKEKGSGPMIIGMNKNGRGIDRMFRIPRQTLRTCLGAADFSKAEEIMADFLAKPAEERFLMALGATTEKIPDYARDPNGAIQTMCCLQMRHLGSVERGVGRVEMRDKRLYIVTRVKGSTIIFIFAKDGQYMGEVYVQNTAMLLGEAIQIAKSIVRNDKAAGKTEKAGVSEDK